GLVISTDGHVNESPEMWRRLPRRYQDLIPRFEKALDGTRFLVVPGGSKVQIREFQVPPEEADFQREFRKDASGGTDLARRIEHIGLDGVHAEVVFPNLLLTAGMPPDADYNAAIASTYNDWVFEVFAPRPERFIPAAIIPVDDIEVAVAEAQRCLKKGFRTAFMPASVPWRPYYSADYDPIWRLFSEAKIPVCFHVFSGNTGFFADFCSLTNISEGSYSQRKAQEPIDAFVERLSTTVIGMAAGMGPIVHLTGGG